MKQKCFLCGKKGDFGSFFYLYFACCKRKLYKKPIPICYKCRDKPIEEIYKKLMEITKQEYLKLKKEYDKKEEL